MLAAVSPELRSTRALMDQCQFSTPRIAAGLLASAVLASGLALLPLSVQSGEKPGEKLGAKPADTWPVAVQAHYRLRFNGIDVGHLDIHSDTTANSYKLSGSGAISVLFGAITWAGSSAVSGSIDKGAPAPAAYAFDWRNNKKGGSVRMAYKDREASEVAVVPQPSAGPDTVALTREHKAGAVDPVSAIMMLTKADGRAPCDRRVGIFDGKQRYDIVMTYKRQSSIPSPTAGGSAESAIVCRAMYEPVAGHRANAATKTYAANRDVEVLLRRIPGSGMLIPYSVTVPTFWGTGSMVARRIDVTSATGGKVALTE